MMKVIGDLKPPFEATLKHLATDGGEPHVGEVAAAEGYSVRQIYRAAEELGDVVVNEGGRLRFYSKKLEQDVRSVLDELDSLIRSAGDRIARTIDLETRHAADSAVEKWLVKYGGRFLEKGDDRVLRFDTILSEIRSTSEPFVPEVLREGFEAWVSAGRDAATLAEFRYEAEKVRAGSDCSKAGRKISW